MVLEERIFHAPPFGKGRPSIGQLLSNVDGLFLNGDRFLDFPRPLPPSVMFLEEFHGNGATLISKDVQSSVGKMSERWTRIVERNSSGIIIFSLGTIADGTKMPSSTKLAWLKAFEHFSAYTIIWKIDNDHIRSNYKVKGSHIFFDDWIPQKALLRQPNTKLFISHAGYNSLLESTKAGVPMLLVPLFIDQYANAVRAERHKIGLAIDIKGKNFHQQMLIEKINTILGHPSYRSKSKKLSAMLHDNVVSAERLLSFNLRQLMKSDKRYSRLTSARHMSNITYYCIDILLTFLLPAVLAAHVLKS